MPHPAVIYLSNDAVTSPKLGALIDGLRANDQPLVFCVGLPETTAPVSRISAAQRRIDLLAIEQNAWVLAGRDARCVVVDTRTELDWAMKNGQISVWAPSKIVLDAVDGPSVGPSDTLGLAVWFAQQMHAAEIVTIGVTPPEVAEMPIRSIPLPE